MILRCFPQVRSFGLFVGATRQKCGVPSPGTVGCAQCHHSLQSPLILNLHKCHSTAFCFVSYGLSCKGSGLWIFQCLFSIVWAPVPLRPSRIRYYCRQTCFVMAD